MGVENNVVKAFRVLVVASKGGRTDYLGNY